MLSVAVETAVRAVPEVRSQRAVVVPPEPVVRGQWEDLRCRSCRRLLAKNTRDALRPGAMVELKCKSCNTLNFLVGKPEDD